MLNCVKKLLLLAVCVSCMGVFANSWFVRGNKYRIETLVITGNYISPRLMAELIMAESRQPYIIVPTENNGKNLCFMATPKGLCVAVPEDKFGSYVSFTGCRRVVILGDSRYVPEKFEAMIDRNIPVIRITGDWERVAEELTFMLNLSNLKRNYPRLRKKSRVTYLPTTVIPEKQQAGSANVPAAAEDRK